MTDETEQGDGLVLRMMIIPGMAVRARYANGPRVVNLRKKKADGGKTR